MAAPMAMPISAVSDIGVTRTRSVSVGGDERMILGSRQVLAEIKHLRVAAHLLVDALVDRGDKWELCHGCCP